jgi:uncharacterized membrane protein
MGLSTLIIGLALFLGGHAFTMHRPARARLVARIGEGPYKGLYSLVSLLGLVLIVRGYGVYRSAGMIPLWYPPAFLRHITFLLMLIAFVLIAATYPPSHIKRWVGHPMITAVILWSLGHLLVRGDPGRTALADRPCGGGGWRRGLFSFRDLGPRLAHRR